MAPDRDLALEIARVRRLEAAEVINWWEAAELISRLEDEKGSTVHMLARLPLPDLQGRLLQLLDQFERSVYDDVAYALPLPPDRDRTVAAILDRVS